MVSYLGNKQPAIIHYYNVFKKQHNILAKPYFNPTEMVLKQYKATADGYCLRVNIVSDQLKVAIFLKMAIGYYLIRISYLWLAYLLACYTFYI